MVSTRLCQFVVLLAATVVVNAMPHSAQASKSQLAKRVVCSVSSAALSAAPSTTSSPALSWTPSLGASLASSQVSALATSPASGTPSRRATSLAPIAPSSATTTEAASSAPRVAPRSAVPSPRYALPIPARRPQIRRSASADPSTPAIGTQTSPFRRIWNYARDAKSHWAHPDHQMNPADVAPEVAALNKTAPVLVARTNKVVKLYNTLNSIPERMFVKIIGKKAAKKLHLDKYTSDKAGTKDKQPKKPKGDKAGPKKGQPNKPTGEKPGTKVEQPNKAKGDRAGTEKKQKVQPRYFRHRPLSTAALASITKPHAHRFVKPLPSRVRRDAAITAPPSLEPSLTPEQRLKLIKYIEGVIKSCQGKLARHKKHTLERRDDGHDAMAASFASASTLSLAAEAARNANGTRNAGVSRHGSAAKCDLRVVSLLLIGYAFLVL